MQAKPKNPEARIDLNETARSVEVVEKRVKELIKATEVLPQVDQNGSSECPFAEELYAKKEETREILQGLLNPLQDHLKAVDAAIERCQKNRAVVGGQEGRLHGEGARDHYAEADTELATEHHRLTQLRTRIQQAIEVAHKALKIADAKRFPGRDPRAPVVGRPPVGPIPAGPLPPGPPPSGNDREVADLFGMDRGAAPHSPAGPAPIAPGTAGP